MYKSQILTVNLQNYENKIVLFKLLNKEVSKHHNLSMVQKLGYIFLNADYHYNMGNVQYGYCPMARQSFCPEAVFGRLIHP